jgi:uncharacterized protein (DUF608 family)
VYTVYTATIYSTYAHAPAHGAVPPPAVHAAMALLGALVPVLSVAALRAVPVAAARSAEAAHIALLDSLTFLNRGTVESSDKFEMRSVSTIYNEEYSYMGQGAEGFHTGGHQSYLFRVNSTGANETVAVIPPGYKKNAYPVNTSLRVHADFGGYDIPGALTEQHSYSDCARYCGGTPACAAWVWNSQTTKCYPKSRAGTPGFNNLDFYGCSPSYPPTSPACKGPFPPPTPPPPPPKYWGATPPSGMRSAVPLGTIGQGSVELRGDGALRDWRLIFNNDPAAPTPWAHKITEEMEEALFALKVGGKALALRTQFPPSFANVSALVELPVRQLTYEGAFPVSRLTPQDERFGLLDVSLTARGHFKPQDPVESSVPAVVFDFKLDNSEGTTDVPVDVFFALPNIVQATSFKASDNGNALVLGPGNATIHSGAGAGMAVVADGAESLSWATTSAGVAPLLSRFSTGHLNNASDGAAAGAVAASIVVPKGQTKVVSIVLSWFFPHHVWDGEFATDYGNFYTNHWGSAEEVAHGAAKNKSQSLQNALDFHKTFLDTDLPVYLKDALINSAGVYTKTAMFTKGFEGAESARFRMWESHSCQDLQPPHIHFYRAQALQTLFPTLEKQIPIFYNHSQIRSDRENFTCPASGCPIGKNFLTGKMSPYTPHRHGNSSCTACSSPGGCSQNASRIQCYQQMAGAIFNGHGTPRQCTQPDCIASTDEGSANRVDNVFNFVLDTYMNYKWSPDGPAFAASLYPGIKLAFSWLLRSSEAYGVPEGRLNTNDEHGIMGDIGTYNSVVYVSALAAIEGLAENVGDNETAEAAKAAQTRGVAAIVSLLTQTNDNSTEGAYLTGWFCHNIPNFAKTNTALQSSVLYGANWAWLLGLGDKLQLDNATIRSHLKSELQRNFFPQGGVTFCKSADSVANVTGPYTDEGCTTRSCKKPAAGLLGAGFTDADFWEMANADFSAAALFTNAMPAEDALTPTKAMIQKYAGGNGTAAVALNDQWDYHVRIESQLSLLMNPTC